MPVNNWKQKKKHTLDLLQRLLRIWQHEIPYDEITATGPLANDAVLALELTDIGLPLPYQLN